jgi:nitrite reductase/ring-hydroxylating ferredoxin subunit
MEPLVNDMTCDCHHVDEPRRARRGFLGLLAGAAGLLLLPGRALAKKLAVKLETLPALKKVGGFVVAKIKGRELLLIRDSDGSVRALTPHCTHKRHPLVYNPKTRTVECHGHGSRFSLDGKAVKGPARDPLRRFGARLDKERGRVILDLD